MEEAELSLTLEEWVVLGREGKAGTPAGGRNHLRGTLRHGGMTEETGSRTHQRAFAHAVLPFRNTVLNPLTSCSPLPLFLSPFSSGAQPSLLPQDASSHFLTRSDPCRRCPQCFTGTHLHLLERFFSQSCFYSLIPRRTGVCLFCTHCVSLHSLIYFRA